jgi:TolA-binding protein
MAQLFQDPNIMAFPSQFVSLSRFTRPLLLGAALAALIPAAPVSAQKKIEDRVDRLEKEMQAVQRKVFPGGDGKIVAPDIQPEAPAPQPVGTPATTPLADLIGRVNAIESQQTRMTAVVEEDNHRIRLLEDANKRLTAELADLRKQLAALMPAEGGDDAAAAPGTAPGPMPLGQTPPASAGAAKPAAPKPAKPDAAAQARLQAVAAIPHPTGGAPAQDDYTYGYRLWTAKFYPEAQTQLQAVVDKYPNDPVASRAANLLGRAYLDDDKPTQAAKVLFENYRARPKGDRAAESLAWVGEALLQLKRPKDACLAYEELADTFRDTMPANVKEMMEKGRKTAKCGG